MQEAYLTAKEIYEIDNLKEQDLPTYIAGMSKEKKELVFHLHQKNTSRKMLKLLADSNYENAKRLLKTLKKHGIES
jgi:hypothetical protein